MKCNKLSKIVLFFVITVFSFTNIFATSIESIDSDNNVVETTEEIALKAKKEEIINMISECLIELEDGLNNIDKKIAELKIKDEYKTYPSIRLNVDIPLFGLTSIVDYKLKISNDVSTTDVASGYSIRDIVKNKTIKVPSFSVASIVVITRDIDLNGEITLSDATTILLKLMQYINQVQSVNTFLDNQINNIFTSYIPKDRSDKIVELQKRIDNINKTLVEENKYISYIQLISDDENIYNEYITAYNEINKKAYETKQVISNVLISDDKISQEMKIVLELETQTYKFKEKVESEYNTLKDNIDIAKMYNKVKNEFTIIKDEVKKYIDSSTEEITVEDNKSENEEQENVSITNQEGTSNTTVIERTIYNVTAKNVVEYMDNVIKSIDVKIQEINNPVANEAAMNNMEEEDKANELENRNIQLLEETANIYSDYIYKENKFYLDNLNLVLKDTTNKISDLIKYTDKNVLQNMKYIYLELPDNIDYYLKLNNANSDIGVITLTSQIKNELKNIININISVNKLHDDMINEQVKDGRKADL